MLKVPCYNADGSFAELIEVDETAFGAHVNRVALKQALVTHHANQRRGTHSTRTRGEVAGSRTKPWMQKHTGRARAGMKTSPIWRGGGTVHGPKPRSYRKAIPKKVRRVARNSAVLAQLRDGVIAVINGFELPDPPKTKVVASTLRRIDGSTESWLIATDTADRALYLAARNLPRVQVSPVGECNAHAFLRPRRVLLTRAGLDRLIAIAKGDPVPPPAPAPAPAAAAAPAPAPESTPADAPAPGDDGEAGGVEA